MQRTDLPLVRVRRPDAPIGLEVVVYRALRRRSIERYQSMPAMRAELAHLEEVRLPVTPGGLRCGDAAPEPRHRRRTTLDRAQIARKNWLVELCARQEREMDEFREEFATPAHTDARVTDMTVRSSRPDAAAGKAGMPGIAIIEMKVGS
jgi:hypothetical protein